MCVSLFPYVINTNDVVLGRKGNFTWPFTAGYGTQSFPTPSSRQAVPPDISFSGHASLPSSPSFLSFTASTLRLICLLRKYLNLSSSCP